VPIITLRGNFFLAFLGGAPFPSSIAIGPLEGSGNLGPLVVTDAGGVKEAATGILGVFSTGVNGFSIGVLGSFGTELLRFVIGAAGELTPGIAGIPAGFGVVIVPTDDDALIMYLFLDAFYRSSSSAAPSPSVTSPAFNQLAKLKAPL